MRIIALLRPFEGWETDAFEEVKRAFSRHSLIETIDAAESSGIIDALVADMSEVDLDRFRRTVRFVARHALDGTVASVSVLDNHQLLLRLRNPLLHQLVPNGDTLLNDLLSKFGSGENPKLSLTHCEVRERGGRGHEGFLFAEWSSGNPNFLRFIYGHKRAYFLGITALFLTGLSLEVVLTLAQTDTPWAQLGQRLGAPMLVSSTVLILERLAQWIDQRSPSLRWTPTRRHGLVDPLYGSFDPAAR